MHTHMVHPVIGDQLVEGEAFFSLARTFGDLRKATATRQGVVNSCLCIIAFAEIIVSHR